MSEEAKPSTQDSIKILSFALDGDLTQLKVLKNFIPQTFDQFEATPTHYAARGGQLVVLRWLHAEFGEGCFRVGAKNGATPAHDAAALGHLPSLEYILNQVHSALLNTQDQTGATPLHLATRFDHLQVAQWLVEVKGCNVLTPSKRGITPVHIAAGRGAKACLKWFIRVREGVANSQTENGATPVYYAAQEGRLDCLKMTVLDGQGNPRQRAYDGMTPLHAAAQNGHLHCVIWLVTHGGVSVMERDKEGATPGHYAAARGHVNVLRWLLQNGAVPVKDELGGTPLHDAAEHGQIETVRVLLDAGADLLARDIDGQTAELVAERAGHFICVECIRAVMRQRFLPLSKRLPQPSLERNKQHRFSIASARSAGKDFYKSIRRRKKPPPNTISSPNLASLLAHEGVENGAELAAELKSSKSAPSSGRSPKMGRRATFLQKSGPSDDNLTNEKLWLLKGCPEDHTPLSAPRRSLPIHNKTSFSQVAPPFPSPGPLAQRQGADFNTPATPPPGFKSQNHFPNDSIPSTDQYGDAIPEWKRLIMARKAYKQLQDSSSYPSADARLRSKSLSEQSVRSSLVDTHNVQTMPQWKRDLLRKRGLKLEKIQEPSL